MIFGFITVRCGSSRLPSKCLKEFGKYSVIEHVIERCRQYEIEPIVCTTCSEEDNVIIEISKLHKARYFRGSEKNKLSRWYHCAIKNKIEYFHTVDADDPFFCGELIKKSIRELIDGNYDIVLPTKKSSEGSGEVGYSIRTSMLKKVLENNKENDTEMIWPFFERIKDLNFSILENPNESSSPLRLTLDYIEDYWLLRSIIRILGNKPTRKEVENLFDNNPKLFKINYFRNEDWKNKQRIIEKNNK